MLTRLDLRGTRPDRATLQGLLPRATVDVAAVLAVVAPIVDDVRERGRVAVIEATARLDGVSTEDVRVSAGELAEALAGVVVARERARKPTRRNS